MKRGGWISIALLAGMSLVASARGQEADDLPPEVAAAEAKRVAVVEKASASTVMIFANDGAGGGSGVLISRDGLAVTNFHVAKPAGAVMKCGLNDGRVYDAILVGLDPTGDIALVQLQGRDDFPAAEMADSEKIRVGDWCFVIGNPFLLATNLRPSVSFGVVSGLHRCQYPDRTTLEYTDAVQTDAAVNPGNSGGPIFDDQGRVIAIVGSGSFDKRGRVNVGVGYGISINQVKNFLPALKAGRIVDHATLGATVAADDKGRVVVNDILSESDAFRRGLRYGDEIVSFGGKPIGSVNAFKSALGTFPRGFRVPLVFRRGGKEFSTIVRLSGLLTDAELENKARNAFKDEMPPPPPRPKPAEGDDAEETTADEEDRARKTEEARLATLVESRPSMANFAFNRRERDRVWSRYREAAKLRDAVGVWKITARTPEGDEVEFSLGDARSTGLWPRTSGRVDGEDDWERLLTDRGVAPTVAMLHAWRRLTNDGPEKFGDTIALGAMPFPGREAPCDVLAVTRKTIEWHVYFDSRTGLPVALEAHLVGAGDPWELRFDDWAPSDERMFPRRLETGRGEFASQNLRVDAWVGATVKEEPEAKPEPKKEDSP